MISSQNTNIEKNETGKSRFNYVSILTLVVLLYILFLLYQAVYFNYTTGKKINVLKSDFAKLSDDNGKLEGLIAYYKTDTFAELEARKSLGMKMPGEKVIKVDVPADSAQASTQIQNGFVAKPQIPNWQKWIDYLEGRDF